MLVKNGDGSFDLTQKDQTRYHFDAAGRLAWVEDKNGNRTTLTYDGSGRLTTVTEPAGRTLTFAYTSPVTARLISQRHGSHLARRSGTPTTPPATWSPSPTSRARSRPYTYDANHRLLTMTDANGHTFVRNVYDGNGRVERAVRRARTTRPTFAYDEPAHKTLVTDPRGYVTTYQYDGDWRLTSEKDPLNQTASYAYDADNNRTQVTDKRGNVTDFAYDSRGNTTLITDALGCVTPAMTYDAAATTCSARPTRWATPPPTPTTPAPT